MSFRMKGNQLRQLLLVSSRKSKMADFSDYSRSSINIDADGKKSLIRLSGGDMRKALNILQVNFIHIFGLSATTITGINS